MRRKPYAAPLDDGRRSERRPRRPPLTGRTSHGVRRAPQGFGPWGAQQGRQRWNALSDRGRQRHDREESLGGLESRSRARQGPSDTRSPRCGAAACTSPPKFGAHRQVPPTPLAGRAYARQRAWESMDPLVLVRRASVITVRRKTYLPRDAVRVERPLSNGRGSVTSQAHHAGRRGPVSSGDKGARQTCSATI